MLDLNAGGTAGFEKFSQSFMLKTINYSKSVTRNHTLVKMCNEAVELLKPLNLVFICIKYM